LPTQRPRIGFIEGSPVRRTKRDYVQGGDSERLEDGGGGGMGAFESDLKAVQALSRHSLGLLLGTLIPVIFFLCSLCICLGPNYRLFQGSLWRIQPITRLTDGVFHGHYGHYISEVGTAGSDVQQPATTDNVSFVVKLVLYSACNAILLEATRIHAQHKGWDVVAILSSTLDYTTLLLRGSISLFLILAFFVAFYWAGIN